jgi:hypothetical protein
VVVLDIKVAGLEGGGTRGKIDRDCVLGNRDSPEQTALCNPGIEIVNLIDLTEVEDVKSYERESAVVIAPIGAHELSAHKTHIGLEGQVLGSAAGNGMRTLASDCSPAHEPVEICDGAWFDARSRQKKMEKRSGRSEQLHAPRNGKRSCRGGAVATVSCKCSGTT